MMCRYTDLSCASDWLKIFFTVARVAKCRLSCRARQASPHANYTLKVKGKIINTKIVKVKEAR